jgi:hypothetical protein
VQPQLSVLAVATTLRYDFEHLAVGNLHGQDNWVTVNNVHNPANVTHKIGSGISTQYSSHNASKALYFDWEGSGYGSRSTRINNQSFSPPAIGSTGITVIEMDVNRAFWGSQFRMGYDVDSDGDISDAELGLRLHMRSVGTGWKTKLEIELPNVFMEVIPAVIEGKDHRIATMLSQGIEITYVMQRLYAQRAIAENVSDGIGNPYLDSDETRMNSLVEKYGLQYILDYLFNVYSSSNSRSFKKYTNEFLTLIYVNLVFLNFQRR